MKKQPHHNKKGILAFFDENKQVRQSYIEYRKKMNALGPHESGRINQNNLWDALANPQDVDTLRNALIHNGNENDIRDGYMPLHLVLKAKNNAGLKVLLDYSTPQIDRLAIQIAAEWHPHIVKILQRAQKPHEKTITTQTRRLADMTLRRGGRHME